MSKLIVDTVENTAGTFTSNIDSLGPSTTFGAVGTYAQLSISTTALTEGDTLSGSSLFPASFNTDASSLVTGNSDSNTARLVSGTTAVSGTWRVMGSSERWSSEGYTVSRYPLCVRIS
jgi:hypothetical protein